MEQNAFKIEQNSFKIEQNAFKIEPNADKWADSEVPALLRLYATEEMQRDFDSSKRNIFANISSQLESSLGIYHTAKQCREKIKKLKQDYKKIKDHNNQSGSDRKTSKWYGILDDILGHKPAYAAGGSPGTHKDSPVGLFEAMSDEVPMYCLPPVGSVSPGGTGSCSSPEDCSADETMPESSFLETSPMANSAPSRPTDGSTLGHPTAYINISPSRHSSPPPTRPGKRKRGDSDILCLLKEMRELEEEDRRQSHAQLQGLVEMLKEQTEREAEERDQLRAEAAEARRQQAAFQEGLLPILNTLVAGAQGPSRPTSCGTPSRPTACSNDTPSRPSSPPPARPGKRKRGDSDILCLVREMRELEEEDRRQSRAQLQGLVEMLKEQTEREAEERDQLRAEAAEARRQQAAFQEGLLTILNRLVAGTQGPSHPEVD